MQVKPTPFSPAVRWWEMAEVTLQERERAGGGGGAGRMKGGSTACIFFLR
jgi:hypothetical protein